MGNTDDKDDGMQGFHERVARLEKERGSRIWCVIHKGGPAHFCGPTMMSLVNNRDSIGTGQLIEILVHSGGGHPEIAYSMMKFFRRRFKQVHVLVPMMAKSAATLMCFGADKIFMGEMADLGPIDIQIDDDVQHGQKSFSPLDEFKSLEFMREQTIEWMDYYAAVMNAKYGMSIKEALKDSIPLVTGLMQPIMSQIDPVEMGGYRRSIAIGEEYAKRMLTLTGHENARMIIRRAVWGYPSHDFCIDLEEAESLGLPVERLPLSQDKLLMEAISDLERNDYHGFPVRSYAEKPTERAKKSRVLPSRRGRASKDDVKNRRVNGSGGSGAEERSRA